MHFAEVAVAILVAIISFIGGIRVGIMICEREIVPVQEPVKNQTHMLPPLHPHEKRRLDAIMKSAQRRGLRRFR